jgi:DNA polymerase-3 subunit gamma/tau
MAAALQRMAVRQAVPDMPQDGGDADAAEIARLAALLPPDETQLLYSLCIHGRAELGLAPDEYAGLTMTLLRLLPFKAGAGAAAQPVAPPAAALTDAVAQTDPAEKKTLKFDGAKTAASAALEPQPQAGTGLARESHDNGGSAVSFSEAPLRGHDDGLASDPLPSQTDFLPSAEEGRPDAASDTIPDTSAVRASEIEVDETPPRSTLNAQRSTSKDAQPTAPHARPTTSGHASFWHVLVRQLVERDAVTALARELALQAELVERAPDSGSGSASECWTLRVENATLARSAASADSAARERLQAALAQAGHAVRLRVVAGAVADSPACRDAIAADARMKAAQALLEADPFVQELRRDFGATIVPGSLKPL